MALNQTIRQSGEKGATEPLEETPHGCYEGWVYMGYEGVDEDGEHVEVDTERVPCRRCQPESV
jgi:hypothetical protein